MPSDYLQWEKRLSDLLVIQAIYSAIELGLIDRLAAGGLSAERLADAINADPAATRHLLRLLSEEGIVSADPNGDWGLTDLGERFRPDTPGSLHGMVLSYVELLHPAYRHLRYSIRTGQSGFLAAFQTDFYGHLGRDPRAAAQFNHWMDASAGDMVPALLKAYDFADFKTFVDVGGNRGRLSAALLAAHPHLTGTLFDRDHALVEAPGVLQAAGVEQRCRAVAGDFFAAVPAGAELYLLSRVLFNWDDDRALAILRRLRDAMPTSAALLVVDMALPDDGPAPAESATSLNLLALLGVTLRSVGEYRALLERAGLRFLRSEKISDTELTLFEAMAVSELSE